MINFPAWLGKNSKKNKMDRMAQEVQSHTRLKASASVESIKMDYARGLRDALLNPLVRSGSDGVEESLSIMKEYSLLREDLDSICELSVWPAFKDPMTQIDSKVKAAFTRAYNKNPVMTPFSISGASIKKGRAAAKDDDFLKELLENEGDDSIVNEENEDDSNPLTDGMITAKKSRSETTKEAKTTRNAANTSKKTSKGREGVASTKKRKGTKL
ncbi:replication factor C [Nesidiocoris tenuis]|uniref:Replication factor C n=1 Tax=Nesidiocoris tenuis TaxID=355587 RepID=A0ABN7AH12_9HEMI|nr:replication factor C [Nesidiocoris tenuis]